MNSFVKKEFTLKNMPARKKTSTKIKTPSVDQFNYRILSLPQKRNTINENSLLRKKEKEKDSSYQTYGNMNIHHKLMQRKNKSLPKYLYTQNKEKENQKEKIQNYKNSSQYRLQTVQEILNKKDSKLIIKNSILRPKQSTPLTNKAKNQRTSNLKYYFQNRKFTNLSKYNSTNDQKQRQREKQRQRQKSNSKFKSKTKFSVHSEVSEEELEQKTVRDVDLNNVIDPEIITQENQQKSNQAFVCTLEHVYAQAEKNLNIYYSEKNGKNKHQPSSQKFKDQGVKYILQIALQKLKHIQKHVGDMSKKTLLLLAKCYFQLKKYDDSIRYFQKVFKQVNYNLFKLKNHNQNYKYSISQSSNIYSKRTQEMKRQQIKKYEQYYELLAQSYKRTQNFLCAIKILDQWERFIVERQIKSQLKLTNQGDNLQDLYQKNQHRQKTISYLDQVEVNKLKKYSSNHNCSYYQYEIMKTNLQLSQRKKSMSKHENQTVQHRSVMADRNEQNFKTVQSKMSYSVISSQKYFALLQHLSGYQKRSQFYKGYLMRARLHYQMKNYQNAIKDYNKAITCKELNLEANLQLGSVYYKIGRGDKSILLYNQFQQKITNQYIENQKTILDYIKFHKSVMYIKMDQLKEANHALTQIQQNLSSRELLSQILYYKGFILLNRGIYDEALIELQKSINYSTSEKYIVYAYFLRIYIHFFKLSDYYGAQYEIDRMKFTINSQKIHVQFDKIRLDELHGFYSLLDMIVLTSAVICILKMKLTKGVILLTKLENKFATLTHSNLQYEKSVQLYQMIQIIYQFMYFSYYTKREFKKSLSYLVLLQSSMKRQKLTKLNNFLIQKNELQKQQSVAQAQKINHLTLESIILMSQKKYQLALQKIKQIQALVKSSNSSNNISLDNKHSLSLNFLNKDEGMQKDDNYLSMIKSICYIQLYDYLQKEEHAKKQRQIQEKIMIQNNNNKKTIQYDQHNKSTYSKVQESNTQILLSAEDLLAHCLITDKENFQILFLIATIHYQLKQYESSLNYIRQAIQFSDDHMIKHYYLKANLKLLLGRYEQAAKDYGNAITVYKELQKEVKNGQTLYSDNMENMMSLQIDQIQHQTIEDTATIRLNTIEKHSEQQQNALISDKNSEYYEQKQEMLWQIYLNRAIAYLKYSYEVQAEAQKYSSNRQSLNNMREMAGQDVKIYFNHVLQQIKKLLPKQSSQKQLKNKSRSTQARHIKLSQKSLNIIQVTNQQKNKIKLQKLKKKLQTNIELLSLLMHTPSIQSYLEISKDFLSVGYKIVTDQELLKYFYMAKELNNCLLMMEKIIKRSQNNLKQGENDVQPFFKSKNKKTKKQSLNYQVNSAPFLSANNIQKLKFDHCVLNALKESSNNLEQDYESALTSLLECVEKISQHRQTNKNDFQNDYCGQIFKWGDLLFFTGAMYFMLNEYKSAVKYFLQSLNQNLNNGTLYSGKNYIKFLSQSQDQQFQSDSNQIDIQALRQLEQLFQNRTYLKQEIEYNIGISYLMMKQYKQAYNYLSIYPKFVDLIQQELAQYEELLKNQNQDKFIQKLKKQDKKKKKEEQKNQKLQQEQGQGQEDITPFPCHNRLCSIYNDKSISKNKIIFLEQRIFKLSFCLPKIQLPKLNIFYEKQVEMASLIDINKSQSETIFAESHLKYDEHPQFLIKKDKLINFIEVVSLKDIEMKPLAPWIKKQKKYIKFTQNILQQSIDLKTQCNTGRSRKKHSKELFGKEKQKEKQKSAQIAINKKQKKPAQRYVQLEAKQEE